MSVSCRILW